MDLDLQVVEILTNGLLSFILATLPDSHRFRQNDDPKHTSQLAHIFMQDNEIHWAFADSTFAGAGAQGQSFRTLAREKIVL